MSLFKSAAERKPNHLPGPNDRARLNEALRNKRLAHEQSQKDAGLWGDMSVGVIERNDAVFVHIWKGTTTGNVYKLSVKRPKEISKTDHEALCAWLKAGRYEGFIQSLSAWNVTPAEAERIKLELLSGLSAKGKRIVNQTAIA
jgi:hypothetical protein